MRKGTAIVRGFVDMFMLAWGIVSLGLCVYFSVVVGAAADEIVEEIPTGLLEKFRKAEEAKERHYTAPDYGTQIPAAQPVPFMQPVMQTPMPAMQPTMMQAPMPAMQPMPAPMPA